MNVKKIPMNQLVVADCNAGSSGAGKVPTAVGSPVSAQRLSSPETPWMQLDDWLYGDHSEPAVLQATFSTLQLQNICSNATFTMAAKGSESDSFTGASLVARKQPRPALVPWE